MIINGEELEVVIERKKIKNIYFNINDNKQICVRSPRLLTNKQIMKILEDNRKSLERMYKKLNKRIDDKDKIILLGREIEYVYDKKVGFKDQKAYGPSIEAINDYLEHHSLKVFQKRLDIYEPTYANLTQFRLRIRKMKSRWGVCNKSSMTITLNSLLIHKSYFLIDYVICHELAHFAHMDHSAAFWKCVEEHYPEYKKARKELRE